MKAIAAALREVDALKARIEELETDVDRLQRVRRQLIAYVEALQAMLQKVVTQERRVAASTDMTRSAMREGAAELADEIDAALGALPQKATVEPSLKARAMEDR